MIYNVLLELVSGTSCELGGINFERKVKEFHLAIQNWSITLHPQQKDRLKVEVDSVCIFHRNEMYNIHISHHL